MPVELNTPDALQYNYYPFRNGIFQFRVRTPNDAHVILSGEPNETHPVIEIFIGGWQNSKSIIRYNQTKPEVAEAQTPGILNGNELRGFWVRVTDGVVTVGHEGEAAAFLSWRDPMPFMINYVGVCTGWGATGTWVIDDQAQQQNYPGWQPQGQPQGQPQAATAPRSDFVSSGCSPCWVPASNGQLPPDAVEGGMDGEPMYVIRARHEGELIPGKLVPSHNAAYVAWGGGEHAKSDYEVLVSCQPTWVQISGNQIPPQAVPAGETSGGEPLFVGRARHEGTITLGKVQPSHGVCYIPYGGQEIAYDNYEILCC